MAEKKLEEIIDLLAKYGGFNREYLRDKLLTGNKSETENKTCPFCGGHDIEVYEHYGKAAGLEYGGFYPECTKCGCRLNYYESREEALKAWNERDNDGRE
jgi:Lar family restriction alleviation protein